MSERNLPALVDARLSFVIGIALQIFIYGFTRSASQLRILALPLVLALSYNCIKHGPSEFPTSGPRTIFITWSCILPLLYIEQALRSKWDFEHGGPTAITRYSEDQQSGTLNSRKIARKHGSFVERLTFGLKTVVSLRDTNQPWHVKGIPGPATMAINDSGSRWNFFGRNLIILIISYVYLDLAENAPPPSDLSPFEASKFPVFARLTQISLEEVILRLVIPASIFGATLACISAATAFQGLVLVGLNINKPCDWPPFFSSIKYAYTLRGFWGDFWHQILRKPFTGNAHDLAHSMLRLPQKSVLARYIKTFFIFFQSAVYHVLLDHVADLKYTQSGSMRFFCIQTLGIIAEDSVQALYRNMTGRKRDQKSERWAKVAGFVWVAWFLLFWTAPGWQFPMITQRHSEMGVDRRLLPYSIVEGLIGKK